MEVRSQRLGRAEGVTVSLDRAIMAPSLNTASSTIRMVGKYLHRDDGTGCAAQKYGAEQLKAASNTGRMVGKYLQKSGQLGSNGTGFQGFMHLSWCSYQGKPQLASTCCFR